MNVERIGDVKKRYELVVDGVAIGRVQRVTTGGGGRGQDVKRHTGWRIHGAVCVSRESAEKTLIERAVRFGHIETDPVDLGHGFNDDGTARTELSGLFDKMFPNRNEGRK